VPVNILESQLKLKFVNNDENQDNMYKKKMDDLEQQTDKKDDNDNDTKDTSKLTTISDI